jgi:hypothetical protein
MKDTRQRLRLAALMVPLAVVSVGTPALAIVGEDSVLLAQILSSEIAQSLHLGSLLAQTTSSVAQLREMVDVAKMVHRGVTEVTQMSGGQLKAAVLEGVRQSKEGAQLAQLHADIASIRDLHHVDPRALETLRGLLWTEFYGPALDVIHSAHDNHEAEVALVARKADFDALHNAEMQQLVHWEDDCAKGPGACQQAGARASIKTAQYTAFLHQTALQQAELTARQVSTPSCACSSCW